jgi:hypothetical protein
MEFTRVREKLPDKIMGKKGHLCDEEIRKNTPRKIKGFEVKKLIMSPQQVT